MGLCFFTNNKTYDENKTKQKKSIYIYISIWSGLWIQPNWSITRLFTCTHSYGIQQTPANREKKKTLNNLIETYVKLIEKLKAQQNYSPTTMYIVNQWVNARYWLIVCECECVSCSCTTDDWDGEMHENDWKKEFQQPGKRSQNGVWLDCFLPWMSREFVASRN